MNSFNSYYDGEFLFLAPKYRVIIRDLLEQFVPGETVWAFGSRATGKYVWRFSDLDLAVEKKLPREVRSELLDALDESDLPIKVDLVELETVDPAFAERIRPDFVPVQIGSPACLPEKTELAAGRKLPAVVADGA